MNRHLLPLILSLSVAGCVYPSERGKMLEKRVDQLESSNAEMSSTIQAQKSQLEAQLPAIQDALNKLEALSRRASADTGVQVDELQEVIATLRGQLEEQTFKIAELEGALAEQKSKNEEQQAELERQQAELERQDQVQKETQTRVDANASAVASVQAVQASQPAPAAENTKDAASSKDQNNLKDQKGQAASSDTGKNKDGAASQNKASDRGEVKKDAAKPAPAAEAEKPAEKPINKDDRKEFAAGVVEKLKSDPVAGRKLAVEFLKKWPRQAESAQVKYAVGMSWMAEKNYRAALAEFGAFIQADTPKAFAESKWAPEALLKSADCFQALKMGREAEMALEEVINGYPKSSAAKTAKVRQEELKKKASSKAKGGKK